MVDFAHAVGAGKISFIPVVSRGRAGRSAAFDFAPGELEAVYKRVLDLALSFGEVIRVHCIDIRSHGYWVVENDGTLWVERAVEGDDLRVCGKEHLLSDVYTSRGFA